jgi:outer membrane autotransporter protein
MQKVVGFVVGIVVLLPLASFAQESRSEVSLQGTGLFTSSTNGNGTSYSATESGGVLGTYRYHLKRRISVEAAYGYTVNSQKYSFDAFRIQSGVHQLTGSLVLNLPSRPSSRISPYVIVGAGALMFDPTGSQFNLPGAQLQTKGAFVYGVGADYAMSKHISLRAEYRGLLYTTPDFGLGGLATNNLTHTAMPSIGVAFRF